MFDPPVVNYGRMERLRIPNEEGMFSLNTLCILFLCVILLGLYKRHIDISQSRERSYILGI